MSGTEWISIGTAACTTPVEQRQSTNRAGRVSINHEQAQDVRMDRGGLQGTRYPHRGRG